MPPVPDPLIAHLTFLPFVVVMFVLGAVGEMAQKLIRAEGGDTGWRGIYYITKSYHSIFIGMTLWAVPSMPLPDGDLNTLTTRLIAGAGVGVATMIAYELTVKTIRKVIVTFGKRMGGMFDAWAQRLNGSSNTPIKSDDEESNADSPEE